MTPLEDHENRIRRLEEAALEHGSRIRLLEDLMIRVVALTDIAIQLLQRRDNNDAGNGR